MHDVRHPDDASRRGPAKGARETAVHDDQRVPDRQRQERIVHERHEQVGVLFASASVLRQQITVGPVVAVQRHAMTGEIEDQPIVGPEFLG